jgi:hypothetical protein
MVLGFQFSVVSCQFFSCRFSAAAAVSKLRQLPPGLLSAATTRNDSQFLQFSSLELRTIAHLCTRPAQAGRYFGRGLDELAAGWAN